MELRRDADKGNVPCGEKRGKAELWVLGPKGF